MRGQIMGVRGVVLIGLLFFATLAQAQGARTPATTAATHLDSERFQYSWRLRGALSWVAGLRFPTSGRGELNTDPPAGDQRYFTSELKITSGSGDDNFYLYQSHIEESGHRTLMTYHGYAFGEKARNERTFFDYVKLLARIRKETPEKVEDQVRPIPPKPMRDVLTAIFYLRQHSESITQPMVSEIYSDGKVYPVLFSPIGVKTLKVNGKRIRARGYQITAAPGQAKKWPGGVKVWISDDDRHVPVRIEILRSLASLQLDLKSIDATSGR